MTERSRRSALARIGDHLLTLLAAAGSLCILLVIAGWIVDVSIIMFRTGSMSPTITAGSVAVVREIPATEMEVGDVVTVDRGEGLLPVTHRVIALRERDEATGEVTFTMRGDANAVEDPEPYTATEVRRVMFSVPGAARVIQWFGNPYVLGGLTLGATVLVVWAFWPRQPGADGTSRGRRDAASREEGGDGAASRQERTALHAVGLPLLAALVLSAPGAAEADTDLITGEHLRMQTTGDPALMQNLAPGRPVIWEVGIWAEAPEPGRIELAISGRGELAEIPGALLVSVHSCAEEWSGGRCATGAEQLLAPVSLQRIAQAEPARHLATMPSEEQRWLRLEVTLQDPAASGAAGEVLVHAVGAGEELTTSPGRPSHDGRTSGAGGAPGAGDPHGRSGDLARTGAQLALPVLAGGALCLVLGLVLRGLTGRREQQVSAHR